jgi:hypothetical protein
MRREETTMRNKLVYWALLALIMVPFGAFAADRDLVCRADALRYDTRTDAHFEGRIEAVTQVRGFSISDSCTFVTISKAGVRTTFYVGPEKFIARNEFKLVVGDTVFITGASATDSAGRGIMLVRSIRNESTLLVLRNEEGVPMWVNLPVEMDPEIDVDPEWHDG